MPAPSGSHPVGSSISEASTLTNASERAARLRDRWSADLPSDYGSIVNGSSPSTGVLPRCSRAGSRPLRGAEYVVATGSFSGTFATVRNDATADYSHPDALGLVGGVAGHGHVVSVTSAVSDVGVRAGRAVHGDRDPGVGVRARRARSRSAPAASCSAAPRWPPPRGDDCHLRHREPPGRIAAGHRDLRR